MAISGIYVMCRKEFEDDMVTAEKIDDLWLCGANCVNKFLKEKKVDSSRVGPVMPAAVRRAPVGQW